MLTEVPTSSHSPTDGGSPVGHYRSNLRDLEFNLFEVLNLEAVLGAERWSDLDRAAVRDILSEVSRLAEGPLAESFSDSLGDHPTFNPATHVVKLPDTFKKSVRALHEAQWWRMGIESELGGVPVPPVVLWAANEMLIGANPAAFMLDSGPASASVLFRNGTAEQQKWAQISVERDWGSTMALTEPDAGSDVGAGRTSAHLQPDGSWHLHGVKRFITSADSDDLYENTFHLVLARPEGAPPGTKGLSLFYVPKFLTDFSTGELGQRNGVYVTGLEQKMGLKNSATCELAFGSTETPAVGWLVGEVHQGIAQMFDVIENARMVVGVKAISTLSTGYLNALEYAKIRVQGADAVHGNDPRAPRVTVIHHPDVRRSLALQKAYAEGLRAVYLFTAAHQDQLTADLVSNASADLAQQINELLLPVVKGVGSERGFAYLSESLQTLGGSGYLQDYPIEQYLRDAKIDSLYEGTTAIQAQDFFFRKIARNRAVALNHLTEQILQFARAGQPDDVLASERALLATATHDVRRMVEILSDFAEAASEQPTEVYKVGLGSVRLLLSFGDLLIGWLLLRQAEIAAAALTRDLSTPDRNFYQGKLTVAKFFARNVLPELSATSKVLANLDLDVMRLDEAAL